MDRQALRRRHPTRSLPANYALEQGAAENALPVEFFARVIWQESRLARKTFLVFAGPFHISAIANQSQQHEHKRSG